MRVAFAMLGWCLLLETQEGRARLSLRSAVEMALAPEGNARVQLAREAVRQAQARSAQSRAALLPDLSSTLSQQKLTRNLSALGVRFNLPAAGMREEQRIAWKLRAHRPALRPTWHERNAVRPSSPGRASIGPSFVRNA